MKPRKVNINEVIRSIMSKKKFSDDSIPIPSHNIYTEIASNLAQQGEKISSKAIYVRALRMFWVHEEFEDDQITISLSYEDCLKCFDIENNKTLDGWTHLMFEKLFEQFEKTCVWNFETHSFQKNDTFHFKIYCNSCKSHCSFASDESISCKGLKIFGIPSFTATKCSFPKQKRPLSGSMRTEVAEKLIKEKLNAKTFRVAIAN